MPIPVTCPCGIQVQVQNQFAGRQIRCRCQRILTVPEPWYTSATRAPSGVQPPALPPLPPTPEDDDYPRVSVASDLSPMLVWLIAGGFGLLLLVMLAVVGILVVAQPGTVQAPSSPLVQNTPPNPTIPNQPPQIPPREVAIRVDPTPAPPPDIRIQPMPIRAPNAGDPKQEIVLDRQDKLSVPIIPPAPQEVRGPPPAVWGGHTEIIRSVAFSLCGKYALSASGVISRPKGPLPPDNTVRLWDARRGKELQKSEKFVDGLASVTFSPGGRFALLCNAGKWIDKAWIDAKDKSVKLWDVQTNQSVPGFKANAATPADPRSTRGEARFQGHAGDVICVAFSPKADRVAAGSNRGVVIVWAAETGREISRCQLGLSEFHKNVFHSIVFTPDGKHLVTGAYDGSVRLWQAETGAEEFHFRDHKDVVFGVALHQTAEGRLLAVSGGGGQLSADGTGFTEGKKDFAIRMWDVTERKLIRRLTGHTDCVNGVAFSPNGRLIASASFDHTVRVWDRETGKELRCFKGHETYVRAVTVSPDGRYLLSGGDDCNLRLWNMPLQASDLIQAISQRDAAVLKQAAQDLDNMGPEVREVIPKLVEGFRKERGEVRLACLELLKRLNAFNVKELVSLLSSDDPEVRLFAVRALGQIGADARDAVTPLRDLFLKSDDVPTLEAVAESLGKIGDPSADVLEALTSKGLGHTEPAVRLQALTVLSQLKAPSLTVERLLSILQSERDVLVQGAAERALRQKLDGVTKGDIGEVRDMLKKNTSPRSTLLALDAVIRLREEAAAVVPELVPLLQVADKATRFRALMALRAVGKAARAAAPAVVKALENHSDPALRLQLALTVVALDVQEPGVLRVVLPILIAALKPGDGQAANEGQAAQILLTLGAIGEPAAAAVIEALENSRGTGAALANQRKALLLVIEKLGKKAHSEANVLRVKAFRSPAYEVFPDVREAASRAVAAMEK